jgi:hypothetical protein
VSSIVPPPFLTNTCNNYNRLNYDINVLEIKETIKQILFIIKQIVLLLDKLPENNSKRRIEINFMHIIKVIISVLPPMPPPPLLPSYIQRKAIRYSNDFGVGKGNYIRRKRKNVRLKKNYLNKINENSYKKYINLDKYQFRYVYSKVKNIYKCKRRSLMNLEEKLFMVLIYLKGNMSRSVLSDFFNISIASVSRYIEQCIILIVTALYSSIQIKDLNKTLPHPIFKTIGSIDHTHFKTSRTNLLQSENYRKDKRHGYIAMVVVNRTGKICYIDTGYKGSTNDNKVVQLSKFNNDNKLAADGGFINTKLNLVTPKHVSKNDAPLLNFDRVVVEITNAFLKRYQVLSRNWINQKPYLQPFAAIACAQLTNLTLEKSPIRSNSEIMKIDELLSNKKN